MTISFSRRDAIRTFAAVPALSLASPLPATRPVDTYMRTALHCIERSDMPPPRAAYALALFSRGLADAHTIARRLGLPTNRALAGAVGILLPALFPLARGVIAFPTASPGPAALAAERILANAAPAARPAFEAPVVGEPAAGVWQPTPHKYSAGLLPAWGTMPTFGKPLDLAPPPSWDSAAFAATRAAFADTQATLADDGRALAQRWDYGTGTVTPVGAWYRIALSTAAAAQLDETATIQLYATLGEVLHDTLVVCWRAKYQYRVARPVQWLPAQLPGWWPTIETPPHPSYPSGHAAISAAAAAVIGAAVTLETARLRRLALDAAHSRVVGGIHWPIDAMAGLALGRTVASQALAARRTAV